MRYAPFFIVLILLLAACRESLAPPIKDWGPVYFPLTVGQDWLYEMDSITLRPQGSSVLFDSVRLQVREVLVDSLIDGAGQQWFRGERYDRRMETDPWRFRLSFLLARDEQRAYRKEDNLEFIKLIFPPRENERWDGHVAFDPNREIEIAGEEVRVFADWQYRYNEVHEPGELINQVFDSLLVVQAADYENLIDRRKAIEYYAAGVGLVYREMEVFHTQCLNCCAGNTSICLDLPWREKAEAGFIIRQWLVE